MVAQPLHLELRFTFYFLFEGIRPRLPIVTEHEVLPDHDAEFIADIVELFGLVITAAPMTNHVHVGVTCRLQHLPVLRRRYAAGEGVERDHVRAFAKYWNAVHVDLERPAP